MKIQLPKFEFQKLIGRSESIGLPPGQLVHHGKKLTDKSTIELISYNVTEYNELTSKRIEDVFENIIEHHINWINIDGLHNISVIEKIGIHFDISPLVLEDVLSTDQRPKVEDYEQYLFFTLKTLNT
jgi:magnesium transporter